MDGNAKGNIASISCYRVWQSLLGSSAYILTGFSEIMAQLFGDFLNEKICAYRDGHLINF